MNLEQATSALHALTQQMNSDEIEVLARVAGKIVAGKAKHGPMNLDADTRHWPSEIQAERIDAALYGYMEQIQIERRTTRDAKDVAALKGLSAYLRELAANAPIAFDLSDGDSGDA